VLAISLPRISEESRSRCLALLPRRAEAEVRRLMDYPAGSAGRVMDKRIPSFRGEQPRPRNARAAAAEQTEDLRQLFIVDAERRLIGIVDLHDLMIAEPTDMLKEIARPANATVSPFDDREEVAQKLRDFQARRAACHRHPWPADRGDPPRRAAERPSRKRRPWTSR
jgi:magnesium transporter